MDETMPVSGRIALIALALIVALAAFGPTGCVRVPLDDRVAGTVVGEPEKASADLGKAKKLDAEVRMGVGALRVKGGAPEGTAFAGAFDYAPANWKPSIETTNADGTARVSISQPSEMRFKFGEQRNTWDLRFTSMVPSEMRFELGVGESDLDLRGLDLRELRVTSGVGTTRVDLSGERNADMQVRIETGVGDMTVVLPKGARVDLRAENGIGSLATDGFERNGDAYVHMGDGGAAIDIALTHGIGDVKFEFVE